MYLLAVILSFFWGGIWAAVLQFTPIGQFLAVRRTWITVVTGVGVDLLLMLLFLPIQAWIQVAGIIAASSLLIIARSLYNELHDEQEIVELNSE